MNLKRKRKQNNNQKYSADLLSNQFLIKVSNDPSSKGNRDCKEGKLLSFISLVFKPLLVKPHNFF